MNKFKLELVIVINNTAVLLTDTAFQTRHL